MNSTVLFVPKEEMLYQAHNILQERAYHLKEVKVITTENAVAEARRVISEGAEIIIARGLQASLIKQYTRIPVVEIIMTAQEMALLVVRAKQLLHKENPSIAVVGNYNMFCDMSFFDELFHIHLKTYFNHQTAELPEMVERAISDHVDLVIGGDTAIKIATRHDVPSLFLSTTEDSMRQALSMAENMAYAMHEEKKQTSQFETLLDSTFNGVMRLNHDGVLTAVNPLAEELFSRKQTDMIGHNIREIVPAISESTLTKTLTAGKEGSIVIEHPKNPIFAHLTPLVYDDRIDGAILSCQKIKQTTKDSLYKNEKSTLQKAVRGLPAFTHFKDLMQNSEQMQKCVQLAQLYAISDQPVALRGEIGTEKRMLAECMHNASDRAGQPFLDVPCEGLNGKEQRDMIFGEKGAIAMAQGGTLLIHNVEELTLDNQYRLYQLLQFHICRGSDISTLNRADVRIMVTVRRRLCELRSENKISPELFYLLSGLELIVPPLRMREEDLKLKLKETIRERCDRYGRYHILTDGAWNALYHYPWYGNIFQIEHFCDRLILTIGRRSIDEASVRELLRELYPDTGDNESSRELTDAGCIHEPAVSDQAACIVAALRAFHGNREQTAKKLGISKATLWRRMNKYGIRFKNPDANQ